jgi:phosphosulfolactate synthase (CoM biosynthesis protein A)
MAAAGLVPHNLRLIEDEEPEVSAQTNGDVEVEVDEDAPNYESDDKGNIIKIEHPDGSISISLDGRPIEDGESEAEKAKEWFRNLVDDIDAGALTRIAEELITGVEDDLQSRRE